MICFQFFQVRAERLVRDRFQITFQFIEPHDLELHQAIQDHHFVFAGYERERVAESRIFKVCVLDIIFYHNTLSFRIVYF